MNCIITYKGKKYSEEQFKEYFINNKQEFATSIAKNRDVIDSFKRKMEGIDYVFSQSPEIASIGSKAEYLQYLSTIFKTSKVKDIVYHGSKFEGKNYNNRAIVWYKDINDNEAYFTYADNFGEDIIKLSYSTFFALQNYRFEKFKKKNHLMAALDSFLGTGIYFSSSKKLVDKNYNKTGLYQAIINVINPYTENNGYSNSRSGKPSKELIDSGYDSVTEVINDGREYNVFEPDQIHILGSKQDIEGFKDFVQGKQFQKLTVEEKAKTIEQVTREHRSIAALKDLSAKLAHRIGGKIEFVNKTAVDWKGYNEGMASVLNEAYMTPDTPFHEILAHPIIRAIKNKSSFDYDQANKHLGTYEGFNIYAQEFRVKNGKYYYKSDKTSILKPVTKEWYDGQYRVFEQINTNKESKNFQSLYQSLLKELETGKGKEVFEQVKRDYKYKDNKIYTIYESEEWGQTYFDIVKIGEKLPDLTKEREGLTFKTKQEALKRLEELSELFPKDKYTIEEQQEEAIVTLLGMMAADKLDAKKDTTLISKLKELWKQISDFVKSLLRQDGIKIDELPITTTLNDLAEILGYGNNKIILPGYKVEYSTPLGNKYDTLEEVNQEIRGLADANVEVDLSGANVYNSKITKDNLPKDFVKTFGVASGSSVFLADNKYNDEFNEKNRLLREKYKDKFVVAPKNIYGLYLDQYNENQVFYNTKEEAEEKALDLSIEEYNKNNQLSGFIEKNKEYEQVKEIIEQWKKENSIIYDPEEVYSRGQGFYSSIGAYSNLELDLLLKNLIQHIQDNKKAGGEFTISAFTKPVNSRLKHIEGTGDRVRFVIYPQSEHIKWAAPTDVFSGSVWDAHEKTSKDKKSELLGVSYTKAPALRNINEVSPNLADIIDNLSDAHNELGIELTTNNFRIEYDDNIDYSTKKLIDNINKILDDKYGKLEKLEVKKQGEKIVQYGLYSKGANDILDWFDTKEEAQAKVDESNKQLTDLGESPDYSVRPITKPIGKQPTQTRENTTSIESVKTHFGGDRNNAELLTDELKKEIDTLKSLEKLAINKPDDWSINNAIKKKKSRINELNETIDKLGGKKEYTSQALTNLKVAALKEVARKYPRSLITSKVVPINPNMANNSEIQYSKVSPKQDIDGFKKFMGKTAKPNPFKNGKLTIGKYTITEAEFNSMTKEEQDNLMKCL